MLRACETVRGKAETAVLKGGGLTTVLGAQPSMTVVLPAFNEGDSVEEMLQGLRKVLEAEIETLLSALARAKIDGNGLQVSGCSH